MSAAAGDFVCLLCGACCRAPGEVRLRQEEPAAIAAALAIAEAVFLERYTRLARNRRALALRDRADGACVFLTAGNRCVIHDVKPQQCRDYPRRWRTVALDAACAGRRCLEAGEAGGRFPFRP